MDCSPHQVATAERLGIKGIREGDLFATLLSTPEEWLDCIVTFEVIERFAKNELLVLVDAVNRVLRSGGIGIIHAPNGKSPFCSGFATPISLTRSLSPDNHYDSCY